MKKVFICCVALMLMCLLCSGCFQAQITIDINDDRSVDFHTEIIGIPYLAQLIEETKNDMIRKQPNAKVTPINNGNMMGYDIELKFASFEEFGSNATDFFAARKNVCNGIQLHKGWFYDVCAFDLMETGKNSPNDEPMAQAFLSQIKFDFTVNLPYTADSNNADSSVNADKTMTWHLASLITNGHDRYIQFKFKMWHKEKIALTVGVIIALLIAAFVFFRRAANIEDEESRLDALKRSKILGGLAAVLIACSAYALFAPVTLTENDIISAKVGSTETSLDSKEFSKVESKSN